MFDQIQLKKATYSNWVMLTFILLTAFAGLYSEFFRTPTGQNLDIEQYQTLYTPSVLAQYKEMILKNPLGEFRFEELKSEEGPLWEMVFPRKFPANMRAINNIRSTLNNIRIRKVYEKDAINIANFSLDSPLFSLTLVDQKGEKSEISFGFINSIDNSTYITLSDQDAIYHIDAINRSLESYDLADFLDSRIFTFQPALVKELNIYQGKKQGGFHRLSLKKVKENWIGKNNVLLDSKKVTDYLTKISDISTLFIIDKKSEEVDKDIAKALTRLLYTIEIKNQDGFTYVYQVTNPISSMSGIKMEKYRNSLIMANNRKYPYLITKEKLKVFSQSERPLRSLPFKKLFY